MELQTMPLRFRVWDKEKKKFIMPNPVDNRKWLWIEELADLIMNNLSWFGDEKTARCIISQDTGLKDKGEMSIYTGDIVKWEDNCWEVGYDLCKGRLYLYCYQTQEHESVSDKKQPYWEVIGNIWQNSELLDD